MRSHCKIIRICCRYMLTLVIVISFLSFLGIANFTAYSNSAEDTRKELEILSKPTKTTPAVGEWENSTKQILWFKKVFKVKLCPNNKGIWALGITIQDSTYETEFSLGNQIPNKYPALKRYLSVRFGTKREWEKFSGKPDRDGYYIIASGSTGELDSICTTNYLDFKIDVATANSDGVQIPSGTIMLQQKLALLYSEDGYG